MQGNVNPRLAHLVPEPHVSTSHLALILLLHIGPNFAPKAAIAFFILVQRTCALPADVRICTSCKSRKIGVAVYPPDNLLRAVWNSFGAENCERAAQQ